METQQAYQDALWALGWWAVIVIALIAAMLGLSYVLGQRHHDPAKYEPFESGMLPTGYARFRISAQFYLVAMFFVIFDLEAVFLFAWAIAVREVGWAGLVEALVFIAILLVALVYLWRVGGLDWARGGPRARRRARRTDADAVVVE